jgi:hypothetical protein
MYASPVSLLRLPPPRRWVNRAKFAPVGVFFAQADVYVAPAERDACMDSAVYSSLFTFVLLGEDIFLTKI